jgi:hypothetical protein
MGGRRVVREPPALLRQRGSDPCDLNEDEIANSRQCHSNQSLLRREER